MKPVKMQVSEKLSVEVVPDRQHEFLMTTKEVANGYGITVSTLRGHKHNFKDELIEGKHYFRGGVGISDDPCVSNDYNTSQQILWTKRGIVRLGFFIRSERARMFRDWAEDLVISTMDAASRNPQLKTFPEPVKRKHNRLSPDRMIAILEDVARIEDRDLRLSLVDKLSNY